MARPSLVNTRVLYRVNLVNTVAFIKVWFGWSPN
jgi:hypothetical protein